MPRIGRHELEALAGAVSDGLEGSTERVNGRMVCIGRRNGSVAVDLYQPRPGQYAALLDTLCIGTAAECYRYLRGMQAAQILRDGGTRLAFPGPLADEPTDTTRDGRRG
jgi:hypothetical protein